MAPSEQSILSNFLLSPAPLPTMISLQMFTNFFPKHLRNHPHIRTMFRELQQVREQDMDQVNENIDREVKLGEQQQAELQKARLAQGVDADGDEQREADMDLHLFQQIFQGPEATHNVGSLIVSMERCRDMIALETADLEDEEQRLVKELEANVGNLSDLIYGKVQGPAGTANNVADEAITGLRTLEDACYKKAKRGW